MITIQQTLYEMGLPQPPSPLQTDNSTAEGVFNNTIVPRKIESIYLWFHWLRCQEAQGQFRYYWEPVLINWGDYSTKHHPPDYHELNFTIHAGTARYLSIPIWLFIKKCTQYFFLSFQKGCIVDSLHIRYTCNILISSSTLVRQKRN